MHPLIDWNSDAQHVLLNPRMPDIERSQLERAVPAMPGHVFVATSGTTGALKLVALSKEALLASAAAVNERLQITRDDILCRVLPMFHVGGLGVVARAHLSGARLMEMEWSVEAFVECGATVASLVPAQVHDLVRSARRAPATIREILVGGGSFEAQLQRDARALGWPVLASYGMTECGSTVTVEDVLLPHIDARQEPDGRLAFRGSSLLTAYVLEDGTVVDPKIGGWLISEDFGDLAGRSLHVRGRAIDFVKIGGESVDLNRLDGILNSFRGDVDVALVAVPDERLGHVIHAAATGDAAGVVESFNARVAPFERIRATHRVGTIPRSGLGKLLRGELARTISQPH